MFRGKSAHKKETVTDTFVSITVSVMAKVHEVDTILQETAMQQPTLSDFLLTSRTLHHYGIPRIAASVL